jgi:hypothetical protein
MSEESIASRSRDRDPVVTACMRLMSVLAAHIVRHDPVVGPYFLEVLRREIGNASCPDEAEILGWFAEGVERILAAKAGAPVLRIVRDP